MIIQEIKKSKGQIAKVLLALAVLVLIALVITYVVVSRTRPTPGPIIVVPTETIPVYTATVGEIKFLFLEATDMGNVLIGKSSRYPEFQKDLKTTERFIRVIVGGQNIGKINTVQGVWDIGAIIDSEGRNFLPSEQDVRAWLPDQTLCGAVLKPSFEPTPCEKIYEVAKVAQGLKIKVYVNKPNSTQNRDEAIIDLKLMP